MIIGLTYDESASKKDQAAAFLTDLSPDVLEVSPHESTLPHDELRHLLANLDREPQLTVHIPYHAAPHWAKETGTSLHKEDLLRWLEQIAELAKNQPIPLTLHGACGADERDRTYRHLFFLLNTIEKRKLPLIPSLETLYRGDLPCFGTRKDLHQALKEFSPLLGWTLDLTHDLRNEGDFTPPDRQMIDKLTHLHIHGFSEDRDHLPLAPVLSSFHEALRWWRDLEIPRPLVIELLHVTDYIAKITADMKAVKNFLKRGDGS